MKIHPFRDGDSFSTFTNVREKVLQTIKALDNEYVLKASPTELEDYYIDQAMVEPLTLHADKYYIDKQGSAQIDVSHDFGRAVFPGNRATVHGTQLEIAIPFEGDPVLWRVRPSSYHLSGHPEIDIKDDRIVLVIAFPDDRADAGRLKSEIDRQIASLVDSVKNLQVDVTNHNASVGQAVREALERKRKLAQSTVGTVAALGIPMKRRDQPATFVAPTKRRKTPARPEVPREPYTADPVLAAEEYTHILGVLRSMALVIERSPAAFATLDEESIRNHFLLQLNGHYEGAATGETFNVAGKTDILIRVGNRNIFIAECKFWSGPKGFHDAISQLLGYLSWRDSKTALLIFNKTKDATSVRGKMHEVMEARTEFRRTVQHDQNGDSRYILISPTDPGREIIVTTQVYDVPVA